MAYKRLPDPIDITIHTKKPGKWRFVDMETGEVYYYDVNKDIGFRRIGVIDQTVKDALKVPKKTKRG